MSASGQEKNCLAPAIPSAEHEKACKEGKCPSPNNEGNHPHSVDAGQEQPLLPLSPSLVSGTGDSEDAELKQFRKSIACFVVTGGHPFKIVEKRGFIRMMNCYCPKLKLPSALTLSQDCYQLYLDEKLKLQNFVKTNCQSVCLTTDAWNSPQGLTYMGITAHFIDEDWKLQRKVLSFFPYDFRWGEEIGMQIETCLLEWGIKKVLTITMDDTSSNDDVIVYLKEKLIERGSDFSGCKYLQVKCIVHIINSVVVQALEKANLSVNRVRDAVRYIKSCPRRLKKFKKCVEAEKIESTDVLFLDLSHMWNLTYVMLCRAEKFEKAIDRYEKLDPDFKLGMEDGLPTSVDWSVVRKLTVTLRPFYNIVLNISSSSHVTSNNFWVDISDLYAIFLEWQNGDDVELQDMAKGMRLKLEEYWGCYEKMNKIVYIASVLDPRSKFEVLEYAFGKIYGEEKGGVLFKSVKEAMFELFNEYKSMLQLKVVDQSNSSSNEVFNGRPSEEHKNIFMVSYKKRKLGSEDKKPELEVYLNEPTEDDTNDFDILEWWKCKSDKFPILSHMARDILAIPKSAVRPDFAFNTNKRMLDEFQGDLDYEILQALICAQDWLRDSLPQVDILKEYEEDEIFAEELEAEFVKFGSSWQGGSDSD